MEDLFSVLSQAIEFFKIPLTIYNFSFSFWDIFLFTFVAVIVCWFVGKLIGGD